MPQVPSSLPDHKLLIQQAKDYSYKAVLLSQLTSDRAVANALSKFGSCFSQLANALAEPQWQPADTVPQDGTIVNVWLADADDEDVAFYCLPGTRISCGWSWQHGRLRPSMGLSLPVVTVRPTFWMPLPKGPTT